MNHNVIKTKKQLYFEWKGKMPETPKEKKVFGKLTSKMIINYIERGKNANTL